MIETIWRLLTAMFLIVMSIGVLVADWILGNGGFDTVIGSLAMFACLAGIAAGMVEGCLAMWEHYKEKKRKAE